jgi:ABC-2 type transport system ATP-binding protein
VAVLWATHLVEEVQGADAVLVLHQGRVRHQGPVQELLALTQQSSLEQAFLSLTRPVVLASNKG